MLCLIVDDGGWIVPETNVIGDVNKDGKFNIADVVNMQNYLLDKDSLLNYKAGNINSDNIIDVFDLCYMKKMLIL